MPISTQKLNEEAPGKARETLPMNEKMRPGARWFAGKAVSVVNAIDQEKRHDAKSR
jgi:hypothetical protein